MTILDRIVAAKREEVSALRRERAASSFADAPEYHLPVRSLSGALTRGGPARGEVPSVIAEFKRASPSAGPINPSADPREVASAYLAHGASALSVLTDRRFFSGSGADLAAVRSISAAPLLRKDFLVDPIQLHEARSFGADAVLLIAAILEPARLAELRAAAGELGLECLIEVHAPSELDRFELRAGDLVGANNRDLRDFTVDLAATGRIARLLPEGVTLVSESGLRSAGDVRAVVRGGARAILVGEGFMRRPDPGAALGELLDELRQG